MTHQERGRIRRRTNPNSIVESKPTQNPDSKILIPPGTIVWQDRHKENYGTTDPTSPVYNELPEDTGVYILNMNGDIDCWGMWTIKNLVIKA